MTLSTLPRTSRRVTISQRKVANAGAAYSDQFLGLDVLYRTWDGDLLVGRIESVDITGVVLRFDDGKWTRTSGLDLTVLDAR